MASEIQANLDRYRIRRLLDEIRLLVAPEYKSSGAPCQMCGCRFDRTRRADDGCPVCAGVPVRAANLVRAIKEMVMA